MNKTTLPMIYAFLAAIFFAINTPLSKLLMEYVPPVFLASYLYLGAGIGVGIMYLFHIRKESRNERLTKSDLPYALGMILLDIAAPIFLMLGLQYNASSSASLLGNFEIVATALIKRLWIAIVLITVSSLILSYGGIGSLDFSYGSLFVILSTVCWGLENNCTRKISGKSTHQIVVLKGLFSGGGAFAIALLADEKPSIGYYPLLAMCLGFVSYGLSIFLYIRAQRDLGAAKTSAYYAAAPFIGSFLSFAVVGEELSGTYFAALLFMIAGTVFVVLDTMIKKHAHFHRHLITHTHGGSTHTHEIMHEHPHNHFGAESIHKHVHDESILLCVHPHSV